MVGVLVNFNVAVQTSVPDWVRGRALAFYLLAFQGVLAIDGPLGWLAGVKGTQNALPSPESASSPGYPHSFPSRSSSTQRSTQSYALARSPCWSSRGS
jgi:hypothetical protein